MESYKTPARAAWVLIAITCVLAVVPIIGCSAWVVGGPMLTAAFVLSIIVLSRGGTTEGILLLLASVIGAPLVVVFAPIISIGFLAGLNPGVKNTASSPTPVPLTSQSPGVDNADLRKQTIAEARQSASPGFGVTQKASPAVSRWQYSKAADQMDAGSVSYATIESSNSVGFQFPYSGEQRATLTLRKHPRHGNDVILQIERGQFLCGYESCHVNVRFDDARSEKFLASEPNDHSTTALFIRSYPEFVSKLRRAKRLRIEANFFQEGSHVFEFNVAGLNW